DEAALPQALDDRDEVLLVPEPRDLLAVHVLAPLLHRAEAPRLHALREHAVVPRVRGPDAGLLARVERDALLEDPLVVLEREVGEPELVAGVDARPHQGHV